MAITNNGTKNNLPDAAVPDGYSRPAVTTFTDYEYTRPLTLTVLKATVENATATTTMANIISNGTIGITKQIDDIIAADFLSSATVTHYTSWTGITHNLASILGDAAYLKDTAMSYTCTVIVYIKAA